ncbi:MAG: Rrf2 family transcriptional regulator [Hyphomicrobiaceae bacterium]|nr:Rrf2 family transcriptional regulator [Hyphomicrobiaceae bacterium]
MRLTTHTDYALRTLMFLAAHDERLVTISEIAGRYTISRNHLMKVVHTLGRLGIIETVRGRSGGLRLARPASDIGVGAVVRALEDGTQMVECFRADGGACLITGACRLKGALSVALGSFYDTLDTYTLADLVDGNQRLASLFAREAA